MPPVHKTTSRASRRGDPTAHHDSESYDKHALNNEDIWEAFLDLRTNYTLTLVADKCSHTSIMNAAADAKVEELTDKQRAVINASKFAWVDIPQETDHPVIRARVLQNGLGPLARILFPGGGGASATNTEETPVSIVRHNPDPRSFSEVGIIDCVLFSGFLSMCHGVLPEPSVKLLGELCKKLSRHLFMWIEERVYARFQSEILNKRAFGDDIPAYQDVYRSMVRMTVFSGNFNRWKDAINESIMAANRAGLTVEFGGTTYDAVSIHQLYLTSVREINAKVAAERQQQQQMEELARQASSDYDSETSDYDSSDDDSTTN